MNDSRTAGMLGLAIRAGQAASGMDACRILIRSGKCGVLLLDGDAGPNTRRKADELCRQAEIPMMLLPAGLIEKATGRSNMMIAVRQGSLAEQLLQINEG